MTIRTYCRPLAAVGVATLLLLSGCGGGGNGGGSFFAGVGGGSGGTSNSGGGNTNSPNGNSSNGDNDNSGNPAAKFTVGGTVSGLDFEGLALHNNGGDLLSVASGATAFKFATALTSGAAYNVDFATYPFGQTCSLSSQSGTATADVVSVAIVCGDWGGAFAQVVPFAGGTMPGFQDGIGQAAGFNGPFGLAFGPDGTMFVADSANNTIRLVTPAGVVSTLAGDHANQGYLDGVGTAARFQSPRGIAVDGNGTAYVTDYENHMIRRISPAGVVDVFAGSASGYLDGTGAAARFMNPWGIVLDASGNLFVADQNNNRIRKITPAGEVSTFAGSGVPGFLDANGENAQFRLPTGLAIDAEGNLYVGDQANNRIRKITPAGDVSTFAGSGASVSADGTGITAGFSAPHGVATDRGGNVYVAEMPSSSIRKISPTRVVTTLAGRGTWGYEDGPGDRARFSDPMGVAVDRNGDVFVADRSNNMIRKIVRTSTGAQQP